MAKHGDDDFDLDDFDDFGDDLDLFNDDVDKPLTRIDKAKNVVKGFGLGFRDAALSVDWVATTLNKAIPSSYGLDFTKLIDAKQAIEEVYDEVVDQKDKVTKKYKQTAVKNKDRILAFVSDKNRDKVREKIESFREDDSYNKNNTESEEDSVVGSRLEEFFSTQLQSSEARAEADEEREQERDKSTKIFRKASIIATDDIRDSLDRLVTYQDKVTHNYQKRNIEVGLRQYFVMSKLLNITTEHARVTQDNLLALHKEIAKPDLLKQEQNAEFKKLFKTSKSRFSIFNKVEDLFDNIKENAKKKAIDTIKGVGDAITGGMDMASDTADMLDTMGDFQDKYTTAGEMAGGSAAGIFGTLIGKKIKPILERNEKSKALAKRSKYASINARALLEEKSREDEEYDDEGNKKLNLKKSISGLLKDLIKNPKDSTYLDYETNESLLSSYPYTKQTSRTINEVIPGLLSNIHSEIVYLRTGAPGSNLEFDFKTGKFTGAADAKAKLKGDVLADTGGMQVKRNVNELFKEIGAGDLTDAEKSDLAVFLMKQSNDNRLGSEERFTDTKTFGDMAPEQAEKFVNLFKTYFNDTDDKDQRKIDFTSKYNDLLKHSSANKGTFEEYQKLGKEADLRELGLIHNGRINEEALMRMYYDFDYNDGLDDSTKEVLIRKHEEAEKAKAEKIANAQAAKGVFSRLGKYANKTKLGRKVLTTIDSTQSKIEEKLSDEKVDGYLNKGIDLINKGVDYTSNALDNPEEFVKDVNSKANAAAKKISKAIDENETINKVKESEKVRRARILGKRKLRQAELVAKEKLEAAQKVVEEKYTKAKGKYTKAKEEFSWDGLKEDVSKTIESLKTKEGRQEQADRVRKAGEEVYDSLKVKVEKTIKEIKENPNLTKKGALDKINEIKKEIEDKAREIAEEKGLEDKTVLGVVKNEATTIIDNLTTNVKEFFDSGEKTTEDSTSPKSEETLNETQEAIDSLNEPDKKPVKKSILGSIKSSKVFNDARSWLNKRGVNSKTIDDLKNKLNKSSKQAEEENVDPGSEHVADTFTTTSTFLADKLDQIKGVLGDLFKHEKDKEEAEEKRRKGPRKGSYEDQKNQAKGDKKPRKWFGGQKHKKEESSGLLGMLWNGIKKLGGGLWSLVGGLTSLIPGGGLIKGIVKGIASILPKIAGGIGTVISKTLGFGARTLGKILAKSAGPVGRTVGKLAGKILNPVKGVGRAIGTLKTVNKIGMGAGKLIAKGAWLGTKTAASLGWAGAKAVAAGIGPVGWAAIGVGVAGYATYKWFTRLKLNPLNQMRLVQYGFDPEDKDSLQKLMVIETEMKPAVKFNEGIPTVKLDDSIQWHKIFEIAGVKNEGDPSQNPDFLKLEQFLIKRFIPVYCVHVGVMNKLTGGYDLADVDSLDRDKIVDYVKGAGWESGEYPLMEHPFEEGGLVSGPEEVKVAVAKALAHAEEYAKSEKSLTEKAWGGLKSVGEGAMDLIFGKKAQAAQEEQVTSNEPKKTDSALKEEAKGVTEEHKEKVASGSFLSKAIGLVSTYNPVAIGMKLASKYAQGAKFLLTTAKNALSKVPDEIKAIDAIRYKLYGLNDMDKIKVSNIIKLEEILSENVEYNADGSAKWDASLDEVVIKIHQFFLVNANDEVEMTKLANWIKTRVLPVFLNAKGFVYSLNKTVDLKEGIGKLSALEQMNLVHALLGTKTIHPTTQEACTVWDVAISPWKDYELNKSAVSVNPNVLVIQNEVAGISSKEQTANKLVDHLNKVTEMAKEKAAEANTGSMNSIKDAANRKYTTLADGTTVMSNIESAGNNFFATGRDSKLLGRESNPELSGTFDSSVYESKSGTGGLAKNLPNPTGDSSYVAYKDLIHEVAKMTGVDEKTLASLVAIESSFINKARPGTSTAQGLGQFLDGTWKDMIAKYGSKYGLDATASRLDPKASLLMTAEYIKQNARGLLNSKMVKEIRPVDIYMSHFLGPTGYQEFLQAGNNAIGATVRPAAARSNPNAFFDNNGKGRPRRVGEIIQHYHNLLAKRAQEFGINIGGTNTGENPPKEVEISKGSTYDANNSVGGEVTTYPVSNTAIEAAQEAKIDGGNTGTTYSSEQASTVTTQAPSNSVGIFTTPINNKLRTEGGPPPAQTSSSEAGDGVETPTNAKDFIKTLNPEYIEIGKKNTIKNNKDVDLEGMNKDFMTIFYAMVGEHIAVGKGNQVRVNSAYRSVAKQKQLYDRWIANGKRGGAVAKPGRSRHSRGIAIDINTVNANAMIKQGLFKKYKFHRPVRGETWHLENLFFSNAKETQQAMAEVNRESRKPSRQADDGLNDQYQPQQPQTQGQRQPFQRIGGFAGNIRQGSNDYGINQQVGIDSVSRSSGLNDFDNTESQMQNRSPATNVPLLSGISLNTASQINQQRAATTNHPLQNVVSSGVEIAKQQLVVQTDIHSVLKEILGIIPSISTSQKETTDTKEIPTIDPNKSRTMDINKPVAKLPKPAISMSRTI